MTAPQDSQHAARKVAAVLKSQRARELIDAGNREGALALYEDAIGVCPQIAYLGNLHGLYGQLLFDMGELARAKSAFSTALEERCNFPYEVRRWLAFIYAAEGEFDVASGFMLQAMDDGEDLVFAAQCIATYRFACNQMEEVFEFLADHPFHAECDPEAQARFLLLRAEMHRLEGDLDAMARDIERAAETPDMPSDLALWLASLDYLNGRMDTRSSLQVALADPEDFMCRAYMALRENRPVDAILGDMPDWEPMARIEFSAMVHRLAGLWARKQGDLAAEERHNRAARTDPRAQWTIHYHLAGR